MKYNARLFTCFSQTRLLFAPFGMTITNLMKDVGVQSEQMSVTEKNSKISRWNEKSLTIGLLYPSSIY